MTPARREPAYVRIARELADAIASGAVGVGERLPTELEIAHRERVSRHTAREALRRIHDLGLVERRQGSGTRVTSKLPPARFNQAVQTIEDLLDYGNASRLLVVRARRASASREAARQLQVAVGTAVVRIDAERYQQDWPEPLALTEAWVVLGPGIDAAELLDARRGVHALLRLVELSRLARVEQSFSAAVAGASVARRLGIAAGAPVLIAQRRYFGTDGGLLLLAISTHRADRYAYANVLTRDPQPRA